MAESPDTDAALPGPHASRAAASGNAWADYAGRDDVVVRALPRGGVHVAYEVASALGLRSTSSWCAGSACREELFHEHEPDRFWLEPHELPGRRLERAIGVVYRPESERASHYFHARLADQFDAMVYIDETHAIEPLKRTSEWEAGDLTEIYPWGV